MKYLQVPTGLWRWVLLGTLSVLVGCGGCVSLPQQQKSAALRLEFEHGLCSGTAVSPNTFLTAQHCMVGALGPLVSINGAKVKSYAAHSPKGDSVRVVVQGVVFRSYAPRVGKAVQGDRVHWHGNPLGIADMYREGYVGTVNKDGVFIIAESCTGDSGSGVFNERGELVAVVSRIATNFERCSSVMLAEPV